MMYSTPKFYKPIDRCRFTALTVHSLKYPIRAPCALSLSLYGFSSATFDLSPPSRLASADCYLIANVSSVVYSRLSSLSLLPSSLPLAILVRPLLAVISISHLRFITECINTVKRNVVSVELKRNTFSNLTEMSVSSFIDRLRKMKAGLLTQ